MTAVTDFHSHILPGMEDGRGSVEASLAMRRVSGEHSTDSYA